MELDGRVIGIAAALGSAPSWAVGAILFKRLGERLSPMAMTLAKGTLILHTDDQEHQKITIRAIIGALTAVAGAVLLCTV